MSDKPWTMTELQTLLSYRAARKGRWRAECSLSLGRSKSAIANAISSYLPKRKRNSPWTREDEQKMLFILSETGSASLAAKELGRTRFAIYNKFRELKGVEP